MPIEAGKDYLAAVKTALEPKPIDYSLIIARVVTNSLGYLPEDSERSQFPHRINPLFGVFDEIWGTEYEQLTLKEHLGAMDQWVAIAEQRFDKAREAMSGLTNARVRMSWFFKKTTDARQPTYLDYLFHRHPGL